MLREIGEGDSGVQRHDSNSVNEHGSGERGRAAAVLFSGRQVLAEQHRTQTLKAE